jgi:hypothetical protein
VDYIVELGPGVWIADIEGDPGRTLCRPSAKRFRTQHKAEVALRKARKYRPFPDAHIRGEPWGQSWKN